MRLLSVLFFSVILCGVHVTRVSATPLVFEIAKRSIPGAKVFRREVPTIDGTSTFNGISSESNSESSGESSSETGNDTGSITGSVTSNEAGSEAGGEHGDGTERIGTDATGTDATGTDATSTDATSTDATSTDATSTDATNNAEHVGTDAPENAKRTGTDATDNAQHTGTDAPENAKHTSTDAPDNAEHTGTDAPDNAEHAGNGATDQPRPTQPSPTDQSSENNEIAGRITNAPDLTPASLPPAGIQGSNAIGVHMGTEVKEPGMGGLAIITKRIRAMLAPFTTVTRTLLLPVTMPINWTISGTRSVIRTLWALMKGMYDLFYGTLISSGNNKPSNVAFRIKRDVPSIDVGVATQRAPFQNLLELFSTLIRMFRYGPGPDFSKFLRSMWDAFWKFMRTKGLRWIQFTLHDLQKTQMLPRDAQRMIEGLDAMYELLMICGFLD